MQPAPRIRPATPDDALPLAELGRRTFLETFLADKRASDVHAYVDAAYSDSAVARDLADPAIRCFVADADGALAAYTLLRLDAPSSLVEGVRTSEVMRLYVDRPWHGTGLARGLLDAAITAARAAGADAVWLGVWERNARAIRFYEKCGFTDVGAHPFLLGDDLQTDRVMVRRL